MLGCQGSGVGRSSRQGACSVPPHSLFTCHPGFSQPGRQPHNSPVTASCSQHMESPTATMGPNPVPSLSHVRAGNARLVSSLKCCHPQNLAGPDARGSQSCHLWVMAEQPRHFGCPLILPACTQSRAKGEQADGMQSCLRQTCTLLPSPRISAGTIKN